METRHLGKELLSALVVDVLEKISILCVYTPTHSRTHARTHARARTHINVNQMLSPISPILHAAAYDGLIISLSLAITPHYDSADWA